MDTHAAYFIIVRTLAFFLVFPAFLAIRLPYFVRILLAAVISISFVGLPSLDYWLAASADASTLSEALMPSMQQLSRIVAEVFLGMSLSLLAGAVFLSISLFNRWVAASVLSAQPLDYDHSTEKAAPWLETIQYGVVLLTLALLFQTQAFAFSHAALYSALSENPFSAASSPGAFSAMISMLSSVFSFACILALPWFFVSLSIDIAYLLVQRLCAPFFAHSIVWSLRPIAFLLVFSVGLLYVEYSSVEFSQRWLLEQGMSAQGAGNG